MECMEFIQKVQRMESDSRKKKGRGNPNTSPSPNHKGKGKIGDFRLGLSLKWKWKWSHVQLFAIPWTVAYQALLSMGFSKQECWSGCHFLLQGIFPTQESNPGIPHCRQMLYRLSHQGSPGIKLTPMEKLKGHLNTLLQFSSVQLLSRVRLFAPPWTAALQASLSITSSQSWLKVIESMMPSNHLVFCRPLLLLPSIPASGSFQISQSSDQVAKVLEFQLQHQSFQWTFRTDFLQDGLAGSPCSPRDSQEFSPTPQFKSINSLALSFLYSPSLTSIHDYWKNLALTRRTFVSKVMTLLFNMLSRLVIAFLPRTKCLLISWLQSPSAVILEPPQIKSVVVSIFPHLFPMKWWDRMPWSSLAKVKKNWNHFKYLFWSQCGKIRRQLQGKKTY